LALLLCSKHGSKRDFQQSVFSKKHFRHQNALSKIHFLAVLRRIALEIVQFSNKSVFWKIHFLAKSVFSKKQFVSLRREK